MKLLDLLELGLMLRLNEINQLIMNNKICYKGDGTKETGAKIADAIAKLSGITSYRLVGTSKYLYYFVDSDNYNSVSTSIPKGYTLKKFDMTKQEIEDYKDWQVGDKITRSDRNTFPKEVVIFRSGEVVIIKSIISETCDKPYTCIELHNVGWRLCVESVETELPTITLTLADIAKLAKCDVSQISIVD